MIKWVLVLLVANAVSKAFNYLVSLSSRSLPRATGDDCVVIDYAVAKDKILARRAALKAAPLT